MGDIGRVAAEEAFRGSNCEFHFAVLSVLTNEMLTQIRTSENQTKTQTLSSVQDPKPIALELETNENVLANPPTEQPPRTRDARLTVPPFGALFLHHRG